MNQFQDIARRGVVALVRYSDEIEATQRGDPVAVLAQESLSNAFGLYWRDVVAALSLLEPLAAGTHVTVPVEPTEEMYTAGWTRANKGDAINKSGAITDAACCNIYRAMILVKPEGRETATVDPRTLSAWADRIEACSRRIEDDIAAMNKVAKAMRLATKGPFS